MTARTAMGVVFLCLACGGGASAPVPPDPVGVAAPAPVAPALAVPAPAATAGPSFPHHDRWTKLEATDAAAWVTPRIAAGESLAHDPFQGPLGPAKDVVIVLTSAPAPAGFGGFLLVPDGAGAKQVALPEMNDWASDSAQAILFEDVDADGQDEAILVLSWITGVGPEGMEPFVWDVVLDYDGAAVVRLEAVEKKLDGAPDAKSIRKKLAE